MPERSRVSSSNFLALTLGSVGVVYGDIGTSPLYAFREAAVAAQAGGPLTRDIVLGVLSLILWSLIIVVTLKYVLILLRADNNGEGGTLSLTALASRALGRRSTLVFVLGMIGAAMFLGDSFITPAISVLSAVEGLKLATPAFEHYVVPITVVILIAAVRGAEPRHRQGRRVLRPDHGRVVRGDRGPRRHAYPRRSACVAGDQSLLRVRVHARARQDRAGRRSASSSSP